ncbi:MAG: protein phosphatase 2C domain-containing protein, partial [Actinomycetota bacterium]|nr:protein phosphatase 2C domain-containing protein [Actinomycetota bacterium]
MTLSPESDAGCPECGAPPSLSDITGTCEQCGARLPQPTDHRELDLGFAAAVTDRGLRHRRNEDDFTLATSGERALVVVCDGVSSSANPDLASTAAAAAALAIVEPLLELADRPSGEVVADALRHAVDAAQEAVQSVPQSESGGPDASPSTTIVVAWADPGRLILANVGDSRAYWLAGDASRSLTRDDSLAESAIAAGVPPAEAYAAPGAHVITAW